MVTVGQALIHKRIIFLQCYLWIILFLTWSSTEHAKYSSPPEVVIPVRVADTTRDNRSPGWLSYIMSVGGERHFITMRPKKNLISRNFFLFTYTDQGALLAEHPFVKTDCYYHGYVDEDPESMVIINTCFGSLQGILAINGMVYEIMPNSSGSTFEHLVYKMDSEESESVSKGCGLTEEEIAQQMKLQESTDSTLMQNPSENWWTHRKYLEYFVVIDNKLYAYRNKNATACIHDMLEIVNVISNYYLPMDIEVILTTVYVWTETNHVKVEEGIREALLSFCQWKRKNIIKSSGLDVIHLFTKQGYYGDVGLAFVGTVCSPRNCGVISFIAHSAIDMTNTVAHEIGHILGMFHDEAQCTCGDLTCIMAPVKSSATKFSNCSYKQMFDTITSQTCLYNIPDEEVSINTNLTWCGNNVVEEGEQCDCGSTATCNSDPCCSNNCVFTPGFQCAFGLCCKDCKFQPTGTLCREQKNECDLPEWCNGTSPECPEDMYKADGSPCKGGGYCYKNACHNREEHCQKIFGKGARSAEETCYMEMNRRGDRFGNCGNDSYTYKTCDIADVLCGRIQCENVMEIPRRRNHETVHWTRFNNVPCWTMDYHFGITRDDSGAVKDGTACGPDRVCIERKCVNNSVLFINCSESLCNMKGVCNNRHHCHCDVTWKPPDCLQSGHGGSIDSGPPPIVPVLSLVSRKANLTKNLFWVFSLFAVFLLNLIALTMKTGILLKQKIEATPKPASVAETTEEKEPEKENISFESLPEKDGKVKQEPERKDN